MKKKPPFKWKVIQVPINKILPTPDNYKLKTEEGQDQFNTSVNEYGRAGAVIVNAKDKRGFYTLINGNTNIDKAKELGEKYVDASVPNKPLNPKQFKEFAAMFDAIRAGDVDKLRITQEIGTTKEFFKKWGWEMPQQSLNAVAQLEKADIKARSAGKSQPKQAIETTSVTLIFTKDQHKEFVGLTDYFMSKFKIDNVTDVTLKVFKVARKK